MKLFLTTLLFLFSNSLLFGQLQTTSKAKIIWGEELKFKKGEAFIEYVGELNKQHYLIKTLKNGYQYSVSVLNTKMKVIKNVVIDMKFKGNYKMSYEGAYLIDNKLLIFTSFADKKDKTNKLFCKTFNIETLVEESTKEIEELLFEKKKAKGNFGVVTCKNDSKMLIYLGKPYAKDAPEKFGFTVTNSNLEEIWKKDIELPYTEQFFDIEDYQINDNGDVYLLGQEFKENKKDRIKGKPNYKYHILAYLDKGSKVKDYEINLDDKFITDIAYEIAANGDLVCSGLYSENGTSGVKGAFYMVIDYESRQIKNNSLKEFDESFITNGWSDKAIAKAKKREEKKDQAIELYEYDLRDFVLREDGGAILLAEQFFIKVVTTTSTDSQGNTRTTTTYHYYYNDVIAVNISPAGKIEWATKIEKYQHSVNDGGYLSSYVLQVDKNELHLIYNESGRSYFEKEERKQMSKKDKNAYLTIVASINQDGSVEKEILINVSNENTYPVPKLSSQINEKELLIFTQRFKKRKFGLVQFK